MADYVQIVIAVISSSVTTAVISNFINRRKNKVDIEAKINEMATRLIDDQRAEIDNLNMQVTKLENEYREMKLENERLRRQIETLTVTPRNTTIRGLS